MDERIKFFTDLKAWKHNHDLVIEIYKATRLFPKFELYGLTNQIRRSASSITANIAEGFGRYQPNDKRKFYIQARGSSAETINHIILAKDLNYLEDELYNTLKIKAYEGYKIICGLVATFT